MTEIHWDLPSPHILPTTVQAADIDGLNHTNNAVYVAWCEQTAWSHSQALGLDLADYQRLGRAMAITYAEYHYLQASNLGDEVLIGTWLVEAHSKLTLARQFQVVRASDGVDLLRAKMRFACIDINSGRPRRMPKQFIDAYGGALVSADQP